MKPSVQCPPGWKWHSSLTSTSDAGGKVTFAPVTLETLVDSPVATGKYTHEYALGSQHGVTHTMFIVAESEQATVMPPAVEAGYRKLVAEALAMFGARHYEHYSFLLMLSDELPWWGLEHHRSSDNRFHERVMLDPELRTAMGDLLAHSPPKTINRRCGASARTLGNVLAARAGVWSPEDFRANLALCASDMESHRGRTWRPLADTATAAQLLYTSRDDWNAWRRSVDYYSEGSLLWLEVDTLIRARTKGAKSIDDFVKALRRRRRSGRGAAVRAGRCGEGVGGRGSV